MKSLQQVLLGFGIALAFIGLVLGGFLLSFGEGTNAPSQTPTPTPALPFSPTLQPSTPSATSLLATLTPSLTATPSLSPTWTSTWTSTLPPTPTNCPPPAGWLPIVAQPGDTFEKIAALYLVSVSRLRQANCLLTTELAPGMIIYIPPIPTPTPIPCGPPYGWIIYYVQQGDTLYHLSQAFGITVTQLQQGNCMGNSTLLHTGQSLYVPPWATRTPSPTAPTYFTPTPTPIFVPTLAPTDTPPPSLPSDTPTLAPAETPTDTPMPPASDTPVEVPTDTLTPVTP